jgi:hypothetical protein
MSRDMSIKTLALVVVASTIFGGGIGALATSATSSSASPVATSSAVQRVRDSTADSNLAAIRADLDTIKSDLHVGLAGEEGKSVANLLTLICKHTAPQGLGPALECAG